MPSLADLYLRGYQTELQRQQIAGEAADRAMRRQKMLSDMMARNLPVSAEDVDKIDNPDTPPHDLEPIASKLYNHPGGMEWYAKQRGDALQRRQTRAGTELTPPQMNEQFGTAFPGQQPPTFTQNAPATTFNTGMAARASAGRQASSAEQQKATRAQRADFFNRLFPLKEAAGKATARLSNATADRIEAELKAGGYKNFTDYSKDAIPMFLGLMVGGGKQPTVAQQTEAQAAASESWNDIGAGDEPNAAFIKALGTHPEIGTESGGFMGIGRKQTPAAESFTAPPVKRSAAPPVAAKDLDAKVQKVVARLKAAGKTVTPEDEAKIREKLSGGQ